MKIETLIQALDKCKCDIISHIQYNIKINREGLLVKRLRLAEKIILRLNSLYLTKEQKEIIEALKKENLDLIRYYKKQIQIYKMLNLYMVLYDRRFI